MRFIDEAKVYAKSGRGGNGCVAWRREKHVALGGPAGGDGGNGGNIIFTASKNMQSLLDFKYKPHLKAQNGENGRSKNQFGANGEDFVAKVPIGTQIFDFTTNELLADFTFDGQREVICQGGSGGFGNTRFRSSTNQAPDYARPGLEGQEKTLKLNLKLMANVGLLGFPNAGKSTLLSVLSAAKPKIADYPFTTLVPKLGVVKVDEENTFTMADIPGLIEGASKGVGLGFKFLKHLERVGLLCHLIDPYVQEGEDYQSDDYLISRYEILRNELQNFSKKLSDLPEIVAISKVDLQNNQDQRSVDSIAKFKNYLDSKKIAYIDISAACNTNILALKHLLFQQLKK